MFIVYGTRLYGSVERCGEAYVATRFFHIYFLPLIPLESKLILEQLGEGQYRAMPIGLHPASVLLGYGRIWLPILALGFFFDAFAGWDDVTNEGYAPAVTSTVLTVLLAAAAALSWIRFGQLGGDAREQRLIYERYTGLPADPSLLGDEREPLRERLLARVSVRAPELAATGYRTSLGSASEWIDIALHPEIRDADFVGASMTLARIEAGLAKGSAKARWRERHDRLWGRLTELDPSFATRSPPRSPQAGA